MKRRGGAARLPTGVLVACSIITAKRGEETSVASQLYLTSVMKLYDYRYQRNPAAD